MGHAKRSRKSKASYPAWLAGEKEKMPEYLEKEEVFALLDSASRMGARNELAIRMLLYTGMRVGELTPIACGDINVANGSLKLSKVITSPYELIATPRGRPAYALNKEITFLEEGPKGYTGKKIALKPREAYERFKGKGHEIVKLGLKASQPTRVIPLTDRPTLGMLSTWVDGRSTKDYLFHSQTGGRISRQQIRRFTRKALMRSGVDDTKAHVHILRHTFAIHQLKAGLPLPVLSRILGHTKLATTSIYLRFVYEDLREEMEKTQLYK